MVLLIGCNHGLNRMFHSMFRNTVCFVVASACSMAAASGPVPMISEVLWCGQQGQAGGLGNGTKLQRADLNLSVFPDAICTAGSTAIFYFRPFRQEPGSVC